MDGYRDFGNRLMYFHEGLGPQSLERFWVTLVVFAVICLAIGVLSTGRLRFMAPGATALIVVAYVAAIVPFMVWAAKCTGCGASFSYDSPRSYELYLVYTMWGLVFTTGVACIWLGVLLARGARMIVDWQASRAGATIERTA